jgi:hypothetical protein
MDVCLCEWCLQKHSESVPIRHVVLKARTVYFQIQIRREVGLKLLKGGFIDGRFVMGYLKLVLTVNVC